MIRKSSLDRASCTLLYDRSLGRDLDRGITGIDERMLGVARLLSAPGSDMAEFAIVIGDPWQGMGVGAKLLSRLVAIGIQRKFKSLWGLVVRENKGMLELARKLGWTITPSKDDTSQVELRLDLSTANAPEILEAMRKMGNCGQKGRSIFFTEGSVTKR